MRQHHTLFGMHCSLYTAKARSYLRKQGIPFEEHSVSSKEYQAAILPTVQRMIMPVIKTAQGDIVQDSADIIRHCEAHATVKYPAVPESAVLAAISHLFELFGGEGLLRPAMHYRWNFDELNLNYLRSEFRCLAPAGTSEADWPQLFDFASGRMRKAAKSFGVSDESGPVIESAYDEFLQLFEAHLATFPYLLGGRPTLGDYALMGPLYAHLYRDPKPGLLMRQKAPRVARWVERMNTAEENRVDYETASDTLVPDNDLPDTLLALMRFVAVDFLPEMLAHINFANQWLASKPDLQSGTNGLGDPTRRFIGAAEFSWRGISLKTSVIPYRFYLLHYLQDGYAQATDTEQQAIDGVFKACGLSALLSTRTTRRVARKDHLEIWE
ncbi:MAG TPA: glutathione S-transferase [Spongiibacteraceae bacterium]|nr:glutathione S-transferase [Spongiibacteraceae bacterium]HCS27162.1 glutathione S-transferase [Spongiibacteraceae bacterium]